MTTTIIAYRKAQTEHTTISLALPDPYLEPDAPRCTELCTLDGVTYVAAPDGVVLPEQPPEIAESVAAVALTRELREQIQAIALTPELREQIKAASPHCRMIADQMQGQIRARYSAEDEMYFARIGAGAALGLYTFEPGEQEAIAAYGAHVEAVRQWGRAERAKLGV